jgi:hypothetical protein
MHERTITIEMDGRHYLIPTVVNGRQYSSTDASALFKAGKSKHFGVFNSGAEADAAGKARSNKPEGVIDKEMY